MYFHKIMNIAYPLDVNVIFRFTWLIIILLSTSLIISKDNPNQVFARKLTDQDRYESGFSAGNADCIRGQDTAHKYQQTSEYLGHSDFYKLGYQDAITNCIIMRDNDAINKNNNMANNIPIEHSGKNIEHINDLFSYQNLSFDSALSVLILLILFISGVTALKLHNKNKPNERKYFPQYVKENIIRKQDHKCAHCKKLLNVIDWDHKNGNRSDNKESNCQALCPNCHAIKTRRGQ